LDVDHVVLTNLACDHLDYFKDEADYLSAFEELFARTK
jgi:UDP-N-acetylmuramoylalanine-D-glutamate ligase